MKQNYFSLVPKAGTLLFALALTVFSGTAYSQTTYTLNYTGSVQTLNLQAGTFDIKMWGGDGYTQTAGFNGKGGYASGILTLASAQTIYIYVGGLGGYQSTGVIANAWTFNGGGTGYPGLTNTGYGNGGGASDIRTVGGTWDDATSLASRAIVAGGGGAGSLGFYIGGNAGGLTGGTGTYFSPDQAGGPTGGSQTAGGSNTGYTSGLTQATLGKAMTWNGSTLTDNYLAGGGGGYYGGASGRVAGGGGSSYIGGVTSGTTIMYGQPGFVSRPIVTGDGLVLITELCDVNISATNTLICSGQTVTLTTNAVSNFAWSDGSTAPTLVVSPTSTSSYSIVATSALGCSNGASKTITVSSSVPTIAITASSPSVCLGNTVTLTGAGALTYTWSNSVANGNTFTPTGTASYTVNGTNGCGTASAAITITTGALPVTAATSIGTVCASTQATLTGGGATSYTWMPGPSYVGTYVVAPAASVVYTVTGRSGACVNTATVAVTTKPNPTITISASSTTLCSANNAATLTAYGADTYTWNGGATIASSITITPANTSVYSVVGTGTNGCTSSTIQAITVNPTPTVNITASNPLVCTGGTSNLSANGAATYLWSTAQTATNITVNPTIPSTYTVTGTTQGCSADTEVSVDIFVPVVSISGATATCKGAPVVLTASGVNTYTWNNASHSTTISVNPQANAAYSVNGTATQNGVSCSASASFALIVNLNPTVTATSNPSVICKGEKAVLSGSGAVTYTWTNTTPVVDPNYSVSPQFDQTYTVSGTDANGCSGKGLVYLQVAACVGISTNSAAFADITMYPNPNNGEFTIKSGQAIELNVISETGQLVRTLSLSGNDAEVKVSGLANGIYFITGQNASGSVKEKIIVTK